MRSGDGTGDQRKIDEKAAEGFHGGSVAALGLNAQHQFADGIFGGGGPGGLRQRAAEEDGDAVGDGEEFIEVGVNQENAGTGRAGIEEFLVDKWQVGADIQANAVGLDGEDDGFGGGIEFAGEDDFLLVAAGKAADGGGGGIGADVELLDELLGVGAPRRSKPQPAEGIRIAGRDSL